MHRVELSRCAAERYRRAPDGISTEEVRDYMHFLIVDRKLSYSSCNHNAGVQDAFGKWDQPIQKAMKEFSETMYAVAEG